MKQKAFYIMMIVCCLSLFSSAKQAGTTCEKKSSCVLNNKVQPASPAETKKPTASAAEISPVQFLMFNI